MDKTIPRRTSFISTQLNTVISRLQLVFDDLGLSDNERLAREQQVYAQVSDTLEKTVMNASKEKQDLIDQCTNLSRSINLMLISLGYNNSNLDFNLEANANHHRSKSNNKSTQELMDIISKPIEPPLIQNHTILKTKSEKIVNLFTSRLEKLITLNGDLLSLYNIMDNLHLKSEITEQIHVTDSIVSQTIQNSNTNSPIKLDINSINNILKKDEQNGSLLKLTTQRFKELEEALTVAQEQYDIRLSTIIDLCNSISQSWNILGTDEHEINTDVLKILRNNNLEDTTIGLKTNDIEMLKNLETKLNDEQHRRSNELEEIKSQVNHLWEKLQEDETFIENFTSDFNGLTSIDLKEWNFELNRLNERKKDFIQVFIEDSREKISKLWEKLYFSSDETHVFKPFWSDTYNDELLELHEKEIKKLEEIYEDQKPILALIASLFEVEKEADDLEQSMKDPNRLLMKGKGYDPKRLLREEQMRKRIAKRRPRIISELKIKLKEWEDESGVPFLVDGESFLEQVNEIDSKPNNGKSSTKGASNSTTNTNANSVSAKTPRGSRPAHDRNTEGRNTTRTVNNLYKPNTSTSRIRKNEPTVSAKRFRSNYNGVSLHAQDAHKNLASASARRNLTATAFAMKRANLLTVKRKLGHAPETPCPVPTHNLTTPVSLLRSNGVNFSGAGIIRDASSSSSAGTTRSTSTTATSTSIHSSFSKEQSHDTFSEIASQKRHISNPESLKRVPGSPKRIISSSTINPPKRNLVSPKRVPIIHKEPNPQSHSNSENIQDQEETQISQLPTFVKSTRSPSPKKSPKKVLGDITTQINKFNQSNTSVQILSSPVFTKNNVTADSNKEYKENEGSPFKSHHPSPERLPPPIASDLQHNRNVENDPIIHNSNTNENIGRQPSSTGSAMDDDVDYLRWRQQRLDKLNVEEKSPENVRQEVTNLSSPRKKSQLQDPNEVSAHINPDVAIDTNTNSEQMDYIRWRQEKLEASAFKQTQEKRQREIEMENDLVEEVNDDGIQLLSPIRPFDKETTNIS